MEIQFCGAAREVTGSCFLMSLGQTRFLVDCGLHQGGAEENADNFDAFPFDPAEIDFLILTHAHVDHSGLIPRLVKEGFQGPILATPATADLAAIMLLDSAHIQEAEAEWRMRKARRAGRRVHGPLYVKADAERANTLLKGIPYGEEFRPCAGLRCRFSDAGHILGSAFTELWLREGDWEVKLVFSGDVGQPGQPIIRDPEPITEADFLVMESTYGNRSHDEEVTPSRCWVTSSRKRSGRETWSSPALPWGARRRSCTSYAICAETRHLDMPVFVDSPLAREATNVYRRHEDAFDSEALEILAGNSSIFNFPHLRYTESADESRALNGRRGIVIISASGMAESRA